MTGSAGICEEWKFSEVAGKIRTANAHAVGADNSFTGGGVIFVRTIDDVDFLRFGEFDGVHVKRRLNRQDAKVAKVERVEILITY